MINDPKNVAAVVLAYSRLELLMELIESLRFQTRKPDIIIVVNQGSDSHIKAWLSSQVDLIVLDQENRGSAGGFSRCIEESIARGYGWSWIFDDDAIPRENALELLTSCPYFRNPDGVSYLASRIEDRFGKTYMSPGPINSNNWYGSVMADACVEVDIACWLGMLISSEAVKRCGLPIAEFFLWDEDIEFSGRLSRNGRAYCVLTSVITHYQEPSTGFDNPGYSIKFHYWVRNRIARAKIEPGSLLSRIYHVIRVALNFSGMVFRKEAPLTTFKAIFVGLFLFWPRIKQWEPR